MKKSMQEETNNIVLGHYMEALHQLSDMQVKKNKRLRYCTAWVYETANYYILQSYRTIIAVIDKRTDTCFDALRIVYGYTSTSAQHIAKFKSDYGAGKYGCETVVIAR